MTPRILLTNDDGIDSPGIAVLRAALEGLGHVRTIAPATNSSGVARSITIDRSLTLEERRFGGVFDGIACDGTPSDCVRVGFLGGDDPLPDLVVSGVNLGPNMGSDVTYSGTVGAAFEAALRGRPALAFSVHSRRPGWLHEAVPVIHSLVARVIARGLPSRAILNVNLPDLPVAEFSGIRPARLGGASLHDKVLLHGDGDGRVPLAGSGDGNIDCASARSQLPDWCDDPRAREIGVDFDVVAGGYVAVTPLHYDLLDAQLLCELHSWDLSEGRAHA